MKCHFLLLGALLSSSVLFAQKPKQPVHQDIPFVQEYSIKYYFKDAVEPLKTYTDLNGAIKVSTKSGLYQLYAGQFLYPGTLEKDVSYRPIADKKIANLGLYQHQFVMINDKDVLSNAWAGKLFTKHSLPDAYLLAGGKDFSFLISNGTQLEYLPKEGTASKVNISGKVLDVKYDATGNLFYVLAENAVFSVSEKDKMLQKVYTANDLTCFELLAGKLIVGTKNGYLELDKTGKVVTPLQQKLPCPELTCISAIDNQLWFGSALGAFMRKPDGKFNYYASERWIPSDKVVHIAKGDENSVLILTDKGVGKIVFTKMTLQEKAEFYDKQVRTRHIRNGFNGTLGHMKNGNLSTGRLEDSDNDGLWTSMYLGGEIFRYAATKDPKALQHCRESLDAMERLYTINDVPGFPSRSFERTGYKYEDKPWRRASDPEWDWKSTTSSDEVIGHIFAFGAMAELIDDKDLKSRSIALIDTLMSHIISHDMYMIDWDGKPTLWGKWNPEYVNSFPTNVGDRKLNSSNITAMLQTAYHFTKKEKYKTKAFELMKKHGYYENLMRPMKIIGQAPANADEWSKHLSGDWNHSDDEMYYMGYWGLYRYAFNDTLKANFKKAIVDHWQFERPEKDGLWNILTAMTGIQDFDLEESMWFLQEYPLDMIDWTVKNSHRKDIEILPPNFIEQLTKEVLPPDEVGMIRHNNSRFLLDRNGRGGSELSAGDTWLLPYWAGRYLGVISGAKK
ncbi:hypothetical protein [Runella slithyformis]|uniref:Uncharacterized protein n=1 Tax=Runella slithyformis (strain ATCC 29530 / DSM 19594 / LMG 11500 / NCIMB 11436 / LSU 4) TaxID=761193 RepID=A0A7U3ZFY1_RUNSL|nr:hypothetical protein [Runella slithyformis]AEI46501.1 hypothetical protein Runsl_0042 [Runella slithyformis DSM 19594]